MNNEIRTREIQLSFDENKLSGQAIVFNQESEVLYDKDNKRFFREVISPSALDQDFINNSDIFLNINHDKEKVLARYRKGKGSMNVSYREDGVYFDTDVPNTQLGHDTFEQIKRGEFTSMSFAFIDGQNRGDITWNFKTEDGIPIRTVNKIERLLDLSIVFLPSYTQTSVTARSLEEMQKDEQEMQENKCENTPAEDTQKCEELPAENTEKCEELPAENVEQITESIVNESYKEDLQRYKNILDTL